VAAVVADAQPATHFVSDAGAIAALEAALSAAQLSGGSVMAVRLLAIGRAAVPFATQHAEKLAAKEGRGSATAAQSSKGRGKGAALAAALDAGMPSDQQLLAATAKAVGAFGLAELVLPHDPQEAGGLVGGAAFALGMHRPLVAGQLTATALVAAAALATAASDVRMFARPADDPEPAADKPDGEPGKPKAYRNASCLYGMYVKPILAPCVRAAGAPLGNYYATYNAIYCKLPPPFHQAFAPLVAAEKARAAADKIAYQAAYTAWRSGSALADPVVVPSPGVAPADAPISMPSDGVGST
jgi:hypothetical protein